jgi:hypothetical protein
MKQQLAFNERTGKHKMIGYYAYLTGDDSHITIVAANDEEAKEQAKQLIDGHAVELWQEGRKVATFHPE